MRSVSIRPVSVDAPAKVNLALHVTGRRADGFHTLDSLVAFAPDAADRVTIGPGSAAQDTLRVHGLFADTVPTDDDNLVLRTAHQARAWFATLGLRLPTLHIDLEKRLPVAAGIGGGSADAAALLRALCAAEPDAADLVAAQCHRLGADVPVCLAGHPARVGGIGERITPLSPLPRPVMLLVNPGIPVATPAVFQALRSRENEPLPPLPATGFSDADALRAYLSTTRNDLEPAARTVAPAIGGVASVLEEAGARFVRMSGSGATVFGLFADAAERDAAARRLAVERAGWWVAGATDAPVAA